MSQEALDQWLDICPPDILITKHARKLIKTLMQNGKPRQALDLLLRRIRQQELTSDKLMLGVWSCARCLQESMI